MQVKKNLFINPAKGEGWNVNAAVLINRKIFRLLTLSGDSHLMRKKRSRILILAVIFVGIAGITALKLLPGKSPALELVFVMQQPSQVGTNLVAVFTLRNRSTATFQIHSNDGFDTVWCQYEDTSLSERREWTSGSPNALTGIKPGKEFMVGIPMPEAGVTRRAAVICTEDTLSHTPSWLQPIRAMLWRIRIGLPRREKVWTILPTPDKTVQPR